MRDTARGHDEALIAASCLGRGLAAPCRHRKGSISINDGDGQGHPVEAGHSELASSECDGACAPAVDEFEVDDPRYTPQSKTSPRPARPR